MVNYTINGMMDLATFLNTGTDNLFWSISLIPVWLVLMISFRNSGSGAGIDSMNVSSFVCLMISFVLNSIGLVTIMPVGIFLSMSIIGLILKKFMN